MRRVLQNLLLWPVLFLTGHHGLTQNCIDSSLIDPDMICMDIYDPVCGCDQVSYSNACYATYAAGVTFFTPGPCSPNEEPCIDSSLIDLNSACLEIHDPVCGCNMLTYTISCYAVIFGGVTSYTPGVCGGGTVVADPCSDLSNVDFGDCDMALGYGVINGQCAFISGCNFVVGDIDYTPAIYENLDSCEACLSTEPIDASPCTDLEGIDFGVCSMFLGYGVINGTCAPFSGCGTVVNGIDYAPAFYTSSDVCESCLKSNGVDDLNQERIALFPNPASDLVNVVFDAVTPLQYIVLYDLQSRVIRKNQYIQNPDSSYTFVTEGLSAGSYTMRLMGVDFVITKPIVLR